MGTLEKPSRTIEKSNLSSTCNTEMNLVAVFFFFTACVSQMSAQPVEEPLEAPKCPDVYDGTEVYLRSKSNCEEYFQCVHGSPVLMQCPDGLYWDQSKEICNWPDQVSPPCTATCEKPWIRADRAANCYLFGTEPMNYDDAQQFCADYGGFLAEPRSKKETKIINNKIEKHADGTNYWGRKEDCAHIRTNKNNEWNDSVCDRKETSIG